MNSEEIFIKARHFEIKIRDLYASAQRTIQDEPGKKIFRALARDEQSHVNFLTDSLATLKTDGQVDASALQTTLPPKELYQDTIEQMKARIPDRILGDVKRVLNSALALEKETTQFYADACEKTSGPIRQVFEKLLEIERQHEDIVQAELDYATQNGYWFDFMEIDLEHG